MQSELCRARERIKELEWEISSLKMEDIKNPACGGESVWDKKYTNEVISLEKVLETYVPDKAREQIRQILYGNKTDSLVLPQEALNIAQKFDFDI